MPKGKVEDGRGFRFGEDSGEALEDAHIVRFKAIGLNDSCARVISQRRLRKAGAGGGKSYAIGIGAHRARGIDKVDGVDAVTAASLRVIKHVVENRKAAEVGIFSDLI